METVPVSVPVRVNRFRGFLERNARQPNIDQRKI
jgi:hypothetical protein